ncbi:MAG: 50S ribosomal protein L27 [bacterium JZ-2024 1]
MAHKKSGGTARNGRDSAGKRLGVKIPDGGKAWPGAIIVRQRGLNIKPGDGVRVARDYTLFSVRPGIVKFTRRSRKHICVVSVLPESPANE